MMYILEAEAINSGIAMCMQQVTYCKGLAILLQNYVFSCSWTFLLADLGGSLRPSRHADS